MEYSILRIVILLYLDNFLQIKQEERLDFGNCPQLEETGSNGQIDLLLKSEIRIKTDAKIFDRRFDILSQNVKVFSYCNGRVLGAKYYNLL